MDSLQGQLLVASPYLPDPNFYRSVVLILEHTEQSATGLVLNRPGPFAITEIWPELEDSPLNRRIRVGGPLNGPLVAVHAFRDIGSDFVGDGLFVTNSRELLQDVVDQGSQQFQLFTGYSGWGPGQLEDELQQGGWMTCPAFGEHVFDIDPNDLWDHVSHHIGREITIKQLGIKHVPNDPSLN